MAEPRLPPNEHRALQAPPSQIPVEPRSAGASPILELFRRRATMPAEAEPARSPVSELRHPQAVMPPEPSAAPRQDPIVRDFPLTGSWLPGPDPLMIGPTNYSVLQNLRYREGELQSVLGYTAITPHPQLAYPCGRNGIQFYKMIEGHPQSLLLVQAYNSALTASAILIHTAGIPDVFDWSSTILHQDAPGADLGRFIIAPHQQVVYCNGQEARIWGGEETRIGAFIASKAGLVPFRDYTEAVQDLSQAPGDVALLAMGGGSHELYLGTTRPASGFKFYVLTPNTTPLGLVVWYWGESGWTPTLGGHSDGTWVAGCPLARTGSITFADTQNSARPRWFADQVLYWYKIELGGAFTAGTSVYHATAREEWQPLRDLWDGIDRDLIYLEVIQGGAHRDYTLEALKAESSTSSTSTTTGGATTTTTEGSSAFSVPLGGLTSGDRMIIGFSQPVMGMRFKIGQHPQGNSSTFMIKFWDGGGYATPTMFIDEAGQLGHSGVMHWTPPRPGIEFSQMVGGLTGYFYEVSWSATLSSEVDLDQVTGIAAPRRIGAPVFPFVFQSRLFLCGDRLGNQGHKVEYSVANAPEVWNGEQASAENKAIFFGSGGSLTAATELYNRFAGTLAYLAIFTKAGETWLLSGNSPESFESRPISKTIGCPAPLTMVSAEVNYSVSEDAQRNIALWLSEHGPVACDGSVIVPLRGIEAYFDQSDVRHVHMASIANARGWYDHERQEYNLTFPSGTGQVTNNVHLCYDLRRQKWYEKVPSTYPQGAFIVEDVSGRSYQYGLIDSGHLLRLEHGYTWGGAGIRQVLETADILPESTTMSETMLRYFRVMLKRGIGSPAGMAINHYADGSLSSTALLPVGVTNGNKRLVGPLSPANCTAMSHRLRFEVTTTDSQLTWLLWSGWWERVRQRGR